MKSEDMGSLIGYVAGGLVILSNFIQLHSMFKAKNIMGLSLIYLILYSIVSLLFAIAGYLGGIMYIYIMNILSLVQELLMIALYVYFHMIKCKNKQNIVIA